MNTGTITLASNPIAIILAIIAGTVPAIIWLFFWIHEDQSGRKEPFGLVAVTFIAGMLAVIFVLPIEKFISVLTTDNSVLIVLWAASEELIKYLVFVIVLANCSWLDEPVEYPIYMMAVALGFAALENGLYLIHPLAVNDATVSFLTGNLRFLGSTLLHSVASGIIGISIGLAFFKDAATKALYTFMGIITAIALHSVFNFFIMENNGENFIQIFGFLWVVTIIIMLLFEKLRRMGSYVEKPALANQ